MVIYMKDDKNKKIKINELNLDALEKISGGFIFQGSKGHKLNGVEISCPSCGIRLKPLIRDFGEIDRKTVLFYCYACNTSFMYTNTEEGVKTKILNNKDK